MRKAPDSQPVRPGRTLSHSVMQRSPRPKKPQSPRRRRSRTDTVARRRPQGGRQLREMQAVGERMQGGSAGRRGAVPAVAGVRRKVASVAQARACPQLQDWRDSARPVPAGRPWDRVAADGAARAAGQVHADRQASPGLRISAVPRRPFGPATQAATAAFCMSPTCRRECREIPCVAGPKIRIGRPDRRRGAGMRRPRFLPGIPA